MLLDLREIKSSRKFFKRKCSAEAFASKPGDDYLLMDDVILELQASRDKERVYVVVQLQAGLSLSCCRCLEPFEIKVNRNVDLLYLPQNANNGDSEQEIVENDLSTAFYSEDKIDLKQMIREQFELELPMKPLCRNDCKGLCQICGTNLNFRACKCNTNWQDPRLEVLKTFRLNRQ